MDSCEVRLWLQLLSFFTFLLLFILYLIAMMSPVDVVVRAKFASSFYKLLPLCDLMPFDPHVSTLCPLIPTCQPYALWPPRVNLMPFYPHMPTVNITFPEQVLISWRKRDWPVFISIEYFMGCKQLCWHSFILCEEDTSRLLALNVHRNCSSSWSWFYLCLL